MLQFVRSTIVKKLESTDDFYHGIITLDRVLSSYTWSLTMRRA